MLILVGPEGDFTPAETSWAKGAGCIPVSLGPIVLRTETAAIYSLSVLAYELQGDSTRKESGVAGKELQNRIATSAMKNWLA